ncbi:MAG: PKD domain-containing protein [Pseudomonadota bacterium]
MTNLFRVFAIISVALGVVSEVAADAANNFVLNKTNFFSNEPIILELGALSIDSSDTLGPVSNVFVIPAGMTLDGSTFLPAIDPSGVPNVIFGLSGGGFFGETIGFTKPAGSIGAGTWDIVEDHNQNNIFDLGDSVLRNAFTVNLSTNVPDFMSSAQIAAIKLNASASRGQLESAKAFLDGSRFAAGAIEAGFEGGIEAAIEFARDELVNQFLPCRSIEECGLAYAQGLLPETPVEWGFRVIDDAVEDMVGHYAGIAADPPDPAFQQVTILDPRIPVFAGGNDPFDLPATNMLRAQQDEAATAEAFLHAMERYQGADLEGNGDWALLHARQLQVFARLLAENMTAGNIAYQALIDALNADTRDLDTRVASYQTFIANAQSSGFTTEQRQGLANLGFDSDQQAELLVDIAALDLSTWSKAGFVQSLQDLIAGNLTAIADMNALALFLDGIIAQLVSDPLVADNFPIVDAGGPYVGVEGSLLNLDASGSLPGSGAANITSYEWDLDGDGAFDDATGESPAISVNSKNSGIIGLKLTNDQGVMNIGYASVAIADTNPAPTLISFTTPDILPTVLVNNSQQFSVNATDNGAFTVEWFLDGVSIATGSVFNYLPGLGDVGLHNLVAVIDDGTGDGGSVTQTWTVSVTEDDADGDGFTPIGGDCDDTNEFVNPDESEVIGNGIDDDCNPVTEDVDQPPVADFATFPLFGVDGEPIEFVDLSFDPNGDIVSLDWDYGDGNGASDDANPMHTFGHRGVFNVTLTVTDSQGNADSQTRAVEILGPVSVDLISNAAPADQDALGRLGDNDIISYADISEDGKWVVFASRANNLIPNDATVNRGDIYVKNTDTGEVILISKHSDGTQGLWPGGFSFDPGFKPDMSANGRWIVFTSTARNLIGTDADEDGECDDCDLPHAASIYLHDRDSDENGVYDEPGGFTTTHIIGGSNPAGFISDDGSTLVFTTTIRDLEYVGSENETLPGGNIFTKYVFRQDLTTGERILIPRQIDGSPGSGNILDGGAIGAGVLNPISADGNQIVFAAGAGDYVGSDDDGDGTCDTGCVDTNPNIGRNTGLYIWDGTTGTIKIVARNRLGEFGFGGNSGASEAYDISSDGRFITFVSDDENLIVDDQGQIVPVAPGTQNRLKNFILDRDTDGNGVFDEPGGFEVEYLSIRVGNSPSDPLENLSGRPSSVSDDGRFVLFQGAYAALLDPDVAAAFGAFGSGPILRDRLLNRNSLPFTDIRNFAPTLVTSMRMTRDTRHIVVITGDNNYIGTDMNGNGICRAFPDFETDCDSNGEFDVLLIDRDADNDGLVGDADTCPNSLPNAQVDELGCPLSFNIAISITPQLPAVAQGSDAAFDVSVTNTGDADLVNLIIDVPNVSDCDRSFASLVMGDTFNYNCSAPNAQDPLSITATVSAETTAGETTSASSSTMVGIATPGISVTHTPDPKEVDEGLDYLLNVQVENTGDINLQNVTIDGTPTDPCDRVIGDLAPGEATSYSCLIQNALTSFTSTVNASASPSSGNNVMASDSLAVTVIPGEEEPTPPPAPLNVFGRAKPGRVNVVWTHNDSPSYNIYRSEGGAPFDLRGNTTSTYSVFLDTPVSNGVEYCYFVRAVGEQGLESEDSNTTCVTPQSRRRRGR